MSSLIRYIYTLVIIEKENVASDKFCSANQIYEFFPTLSPKLDKVKIHVLTKHIRSYKTCKWISNLTSSGTEWSSTLRVAFRLAGVVLLLLMILIVVMMMIMGLGKALIKKKRFLSGIAQMRGGGLPMPDFLALFKKCIFGQ